MPYGIPYGIGAQTVVLHAVAANGHTQAGISTAIANVGTIVAAGLGIDLIVSQIVGAVALLCVL